MQTMSEMWPLADVQMIFRFDNAYFYNNSRPNDCNSGHWHLLVQRFVFIVLHLSCF